MRDLKPTQMDRLTQITNELESLHRELGRAVGAKRKELTERISLLTDEMARMFRRGMEQVQRQR